MALYNTVTAVIAVVAVYSLLLHIGLRLHFSLMPPTLLRLLLKRHLLLLQILDFLQRVIKPLLCSSRLSLVAISLLGTIAGRGGSGGGQPVSRAGPRKNNGIGVCLASPK